MLPLNLITQRIRSSLSLNYGLIYWVRVKIVASRSGPFSDSARFGVCWGNSATFCLRKRRSDRRPGTHPPRTGTRDGRFILNEALISERQPLLMIRDDCVACLLTKSPLAPVRCGQNRLSSLFRYGPRHLKETVIVLNYG